MNANKGSLLFVRGYFKLITVILLLDGSTTMNAEEEFRVPNESRTRRSLTTICVEIKPSRQQDEPYLMCKGAHLPEYEPHHPLINGGRNYFENNHAKPNMIFMPDLEQIQNNHVRQEQFPRYLHNFHQHQSVLESAKQNLPEYLTANNQHPQFNGHISAASPSPPSLYGGPINGNQGFYEFNDRSFVNTSPFELARVVNSNEFNSQTAAEQQTQTQTFQHPFHPHIPPINIPTTTPGIAKTLEADNHELGLHEPTNEMNRRNVDANTFTEARPQEIAYTHSSSEAVNREKVHTNLYSSPYGNDPLMQQFYSAQHEPLMVTNTPQKDLFDAPNVPRYVEALPHPGPNHLMHVHTPRRNTMENQYNNFQNEAISVSVTPTHNYCNNFPPVPTYAFPPLIIALPSYNTMPFTATNNNPSHSNYIRANECSHIPQPTEVVALPFHPLINTLQHRIFPNFNVMTGLSGLLGSARKMFPAFHNTPHAFRSSEPITGTTNPSTLPNAPQVTSVESTKTMDNLNVAQAHVEENNGAEHLSNIQSTTVPTPTDVVEHSVIVGNSREDSSTTQHIESESSSTDSTSDLKTSSSTEAGESSEESTKNILTIIEKARRLQMRHRIKD